MIQRKEYALIRSRLLEPRHFIQVVLGPRQVGKTTTIRQVLSSLEAPHLYFSADSVPTAGEAWISSCWNAARLLSKQNSNSDVVLAIDEIQKISNWSEAVKKEWDADSWENRPIKVVLLGSSRALIMSGLSESLMGRFEEIRMPHWTWQEMREAYGFSLEEYIFFGGYPGAAFLRKDAERWKELVQSSMIDATVNRDVLNEGAVGNPALMRKALELGIAYSGRILSLTKMLGELQGRGNVATIANYIEKLHQCGLLAALQKYTVDAARRRASIPKFQVHNNALLSAGSPYGFEEIRSRPALWGRWVESAVGAYLVSEAFRSRFEVMYWRDGDREVDFILRIRGKIVALEVKSNAEKHASGLDLFRSKFAPAASFIVGDGGLPLETFFATNPLDLVG